MWAIRVPLRKVGSRVLVFCLIALCLVWLDVRGILEPIRTPITITVTPVITGFDSLRQQLGSSVTTFKPNKELVQKQAIITSQQNELLEAKQQVYELQAANQALKEALALRADHEPQLISGKIIWVSDILLIKIDQPQEIKPGAAVRIGSSLLGLVKAKRSMSLYEVLPTVHPSFKAKVQVRHNGTFIDGLSEGQFNTHARLTRVLSIASIAENDLVYYNDETHEEGIALIVGKLREINQDQTLVFREAKVIPLFDVTTQRNVFIMTDNR